MKRVAISPAATIGDMSDDEVQEVAGPSSGFGLIGGSSAKSSEKPATPTKSKSKAIAKRTRDPGSGLVLSVPFEGRTLTSTAEIEKVLDTLGPDEKRLLISMGNKSIEQALEVGDDNLVDWYDMTTKHLAKEKGFDKEEYNRSNENLYDRVQDVVNRRDKRSESEKRLDRLLISNRAKMFRKHYMEAISGNKARGQLATLAEKVKPFPLMIKALNKFIFDEAWLKRIEGGGALRGRKSTGLSPGTVNQCWTAQKDDADFLEKIQTLPSDKALAKIKFKVSRCGLLVSTDKNETVPSGDFSDESETHIFMVTEQEVVPKEAKRSTATPDPGSEVAASQATSLASPTPDPGLETKAPKAVERSTATPDPGSKVDKVINPAPPSTVSTTPLSEPPTDLSEPYEPIEVPPTDDPGPEVEEPVIPDPLEDLVPDPVPESSRQKETRVSAPTKSPKEVAKKPTPVPSADQLPDPAPLDIVGPGSLAKPPPKQLSN
jgi:hypothetical protein